MPQQQQCSLQHDTKQHSSSSRMIICGLRYAAVEQRTKNTDNHHAPYSSSEADNHDRGRVGCHKSASNGAMELGAVRLRQYDLLNEYRDVVFRGLASLRSPCIKHNGCARQWYLVGVDRSFDSSLWSYLRCYSTT